MKNLNIVKFKALTTNNEDLSGNSRAFHPVSKHQLSIILGRVRSTLWLWCFKQFHALYGKEKLTDCLEFTCRVVKGFKKENLTKCSVDVVGGDKTSFPYIFVSYRQITIL